MNRTQKTITVILLLVLTAMAASTGQESVTIRKPAMDGEQVGRTVTLSGSANISSTHHLWLFAHRQSTQQWWLQGEAKVNEKHEWELVVSIGERDDISKKFEIKVLVLNDADHQKMLNRLEQGRPILELPDPVISPADLMVTKVAHD